MAKEYIEREAALRVLCDACGNAACPKGLIPRCPYYEKMQSIPAADVRPVVKATWRRYSPFTDTYECSNCGEQVIDESFRTNFCPNCGADMRETNDEEA